MNEPWKGDTTIRWSPGARVSVQAEGLDGPSLEAAAQAAARILRAYVKRCKRSRAGAFWRLSKREDQGIKLISATFIADGGASNE